MRDIVPANPIPSSAYYATKSSVTLRIWNIVFLFDKYDLIIIVGKISNVYYPVSADLTSNRVHRDNIIYKCFRVMVRRLATTLLSRIINGSMFQFNIITRDII